MLRRAIFLLVLVPFLAGSCKKKPAESSYCAVFAHYPGEENIIIEETYSDWKNGTVRLSAEGFDHEQLKLYLPAVSGTGTLPLSAENISFSDGLDFESQKVLEGSVVITNAGEQVVTGEFRVRLLDDVNGTEERWLEGSFSVANR